MMSSIYDFDFVRSKTDNVGIVTRVGSNAVKVLWMDGTETTENKSDLKVADRAFFPGDFVAAASDPTGQRGCVVDANVNVDLLTHDGSVLQDISSRDLIHITDFTIDLYVALGTWVGRIVETFHDVTVQLDDGSVCKIKDADPRHLRVDGRHIRESEFLPHNNPYYPGQRVKAHSSEFFDRRVTWLHGRSGRVEGIVTQVTLGSVTVGWIGSAGCGPDSATTPDEQQSANKLKLLPFLQHTTFQLGNLCLLRSCRKSSCMPLDKGSAKPDCNASAKDDLESTETGNVSNAEAGTLEESTEKDDNMEASLNKISETSNNSASTEGLCHSSVPASKEVVHETWLLHLEKIRRVLVKRDKKVEKGLLIINAKTKVDVAWQDGTITRGLDSASLIHTNRPLPGAEDHEFAAGQYVMEKAADSDDAIETRRVGVVKSVNAKDRTACVRWLEPVARAGESREFNEEEVVSVNELEGHPDYGYYLYGEVVGRELHISLPAKMDSFVHPFESMQLNSSDEPEHEDGKHHGKNNSEKTPAHEVSHDVSAEFSDVSWVGIVTGLKDGGIEVTWADGTVSTVGPEAIFVVDQDDDESIAAGSDASDACLVY